MPGLVVVDVVDSSFVMEWNRNNEERAIEVGMLVVEVSWAMGGIFECHQCKGISPKKTPACLYIVIQKSQEVSHEIHIPS